MENKTIKKLSKGERAELKEWCESTWSKHLSPLVKHYRCFWYHRCCLVITKRENANHKSHPPESTISSADMAATKGGLNSQSFYDFMLGEINQQRSKTVEFLLPQIDAAHTTRIDNLSSIARLERENSSLRKRVADLETILARAPMKHRNANLKL